VPLSKDQAAALLRRLIAEHGELIGGAALSRCLGYRTQRAFQMGIKRGQVPVETFNLPGRRGRYARTFEVAAWLAACGTDATPYADAPVDRAAS
jgi:hypothetical protein